MNVSEQIWKQYHSELRAFIRGKVRDDFAADDIMQDVFLKMHSGLPALKNRTKIKSWLYQITRNTIIDYFRSRHPNVDLPDDIAEPGADPGEEVLQELASCLVPMMYLLPDTHRDAVYLSEIKGLTQKEIANRQGISLSGAKSRVQRGRAELKELLDLCCEYEFDQAGRLSEYKRRKCDCATDCES